MPAYLPDVLMTAGGYSRRSPVRGIGSAPPASGAVVMGTGIVSVGLSSDGRHTLSLVLLGTAAAVWVVLGSVLAWRAITDRARIKREARLPGALTSVAATAVLGARVSILGWQGVAAALLVVAAALWLIQLPWVLGNLPAAAPGAAFMPAVATQSLAVLAAQVAARVDAPWLLYAGLVLLGLGLVLYVLVLARFDFRQLVIGQGDHWVGGGALAIAALAAAQITLSARGHHELRGVAGGLQALTLVLWALSAAWLPALILTEALRPRVAYELRRWATVFPVGMYAACSFEAGLASHASGLRDFAQVWLWLAFALWLLVFGSMLLTSPLRSAGKAPATPGCIAGRREPRA